MTVNKTFDSNYRDNSSDMSCCEDRMDGWDICASTLCNLCVCVPEWHWLWFSYNVLVWLEDQAMKLLYDFSTPPRLG